MLKDITLGQYFPGESLIHRADPRVKLVVAFIFMVTILIINSYLGFLLFSMFVLISVMVSKVPIKYSIKGLKPLLLIILISSVINIFTTEGRVLIQFNFIRITYEGLDIAAKVTLRLSLLIVSTSLLTLTTTPISLTDAIERLLKPLKRVGVPVHELAMMMTIALRFVPTLLDEAEKIMKAQASRGADFETGNIVQRAKSFIPILVPLFVSAFRRADELALAMESRCYRGDINRTRMKQLKLSDIDYKILATVFIFEILLVYIQYNKITV